MYYNLANECDIKLAHLRGRIGTEQNTLRPGGHSKGENDMKRTKKVIALALVLVMAAALLSGCGEAGIAVISAIFAQPDIEAACRELREMVRKL